MALINPTDITFSVILETALGTTPTVGTRYEFPASADQAPLTYKAAQIASNTKRTNRESNLAQRGMVSIDGTFETRMTFGPVIDLFIASGLSGAWVANKCAGGVTDSSFSVITVNKQNTAVDPAPGNGDVYQDAGVMVNNLSISGKVGEGISLSIGMLGLTRTPAVKDHVLAVTKLPSSSFEYQFKDVTAKIGSDAYGIVEFAFETTQNRELRGVMGTLNPIDIGTSGVRQTKLTLKLYRNSLSTLMPSITGLGQKVTIDIGVAGNGYRITLPNASGEIPTDELNGSSVYQNIVFTAGLDETSQAGVIIERI